MNGMLGTTRAQPSQFPEQKLETVTPDDPNL